ncbi:MAG: PAS domain S-box protein [Verrucomicrobiota bacterium]|nr:PAS domain S-box protein [Verrucomicrobiota bacterium]
MKASVESKITLGFAASVLALVVMGGLSYRTTRTPVATEGWVSHSHDVITTLESGQALLTDVETDQRGYLLTGDKRFLEDCLHAQAQVRGWLGQVRQLTADNPAQQQRLDRLQALISRRLAALNQRIQLRQQRGIQSVSGDVAALRQGEALMADVWQGLARIRDAEDRLLNARQRAAQASARLNLLIILAGSGLACAVGLGAVLAIRRDLKLRRQAEQALRQNEERFRLMVGNIKDYAIFMLDPAGRVISWNDGAQRIKGYTAAEIVGEHFSRFYPDEVVRAGFPQKALAEAEAAGRVEDDGWRVRKDGSRFWANVVITAVRDQDGRLLGFVKVTRDLTERRRMEQMREERDRFFDLSRDLICVAGFDGYFKTLNPAWERTLGFSDEELLARPFLEFIHPDDAAASQAEVGRLASGHETVNFENRFRCRDGAWRWFAWNARAVAAAQLIYAIGRDTTERKRNQEKIVQLNAELQRHARQLEETNRELEAFSYSVSHDLRAPLRHIDGFVKLLEKQAAQKLDNQGRRYLGIIADSAQRMGALIDDLLIFSRMGRTELRRTRVSSGALVHEAIEALQSETNGRRIRWKIGELPEVLADPSMLRQVWVNLIANAVKYTRPRDPAEIEIGCQDSGNGERVFFVRDNGVGFDMDYAHKLFGVFQRLHRSDEFEGTGIGLANVSRILHRHGGRAWAEGKIDCGATFFFSLPEASADIGG